MKIDVRCGGLFDGRPCGHKLGTMKQVHDEDLLRLALKPRKRVIIARSVLRMGDP